MYLPDEYYNPLRNYPDEYLRFESYCLRRLFNADVHLARKDVQLRIRFLLTCLRERLSALKARRGHNYHVNLCLDNIEGGCSRFDFLPACARACSFAAFSAETKASSHLLRLLRRCDPVDILSRLATSLLGGANGYQLRVANGFFILLLSLYLSLSDCLFQQARLLDLRRRWAVG